MLTDLSVLSLNLALPREGHLEAIFYMFAHLEKKHNAILVFDPAIFKERDWKEFCSDVVKEAIPPNALESWGKDVDVCVF